MPATDMYGDVLCVGQRVRMMDNNRLSDMLREFDRDGFDTGALYGRIVSCQYGGMLPDHQVAVVWEGLTRRSDGMVQTTDLHEATDHLARATEATEANDSVGTANQTTNEGEEMPRNTRVTMSVRPSPIVAQRVIEDHGIAAELGTNLTPEAWEQARQRVEGLLQPVEWGVNRGSYYNDSYPEVRYSGEYGTYYVEELSLDDAREYVNLASDGNLELVEVPASEYSAAGGYLEAGQKVFAVQPRAEIAALAFRRFSTRYIPATVYGNTESLSIRRLSDAMGYYPSFLTSGRRRELLREALRERMNARPENKKHKDVDWDDAARVEKFDKFMNSLRSKLTVEDKPFEKLPILPRGTLSSRTWGIEIEAVDIAGVNTPKAWELKGDGSLRNLSASSQPSRTWVEPEAEVEADPQPDPRPDEPSMDDHEEECPRYEDYDDEYDCECGYDDVWEEYSAEFRAWRSRNSTAVNVSDIRSSTGEWNSPVLRSFHSRGLKYLCDELEPRRTNDSAGIHVHVGAEDLTARQAIQLSVMFTALEPLFEAQYMRTGSRNYCNSQTTSELIARFRSLANVRKQGHNDATKMRHNSRYWTLNLASLATHKTVEFRGMGPVYNYDHLVRWAYLCREMVNIAKANVPQSVWSKVTSMEDLVVLFSKYGKETPTPEWAADEVAEDVVDKIVAKLGKEERETPSSRFLNPDFSDLRVVMDDYADTTQLLVGGNNSRW